MKKLLFIFSLLIVFSTTQAAPRKQIVFFGDSLTDNGNLYRISLKIIPKSPPYFEGRFSNGLTWAEHFALNFNYTYQIYAVGGATAVFHMPTSKFLAPTTLFFEIYKYLLDTLFEDRSNNLFVIWIGDNDYMFYEDTDPQQGTTKVVDGIMSGIVTLANYGAKNFLVLNLMDTSRTPYVQINGTGEKIHNLVKLHNLKLAAALDEFRTSRPDINLTAIDTYSFFNDILEQTEKYNRLYHVNITDTATACWEGGMTLKMLEQSKDDFTSNSPELTYSYVLGKSLDAGNIPCGNPNEHIFWDEMHPTAVFHQLLAQIVIAGMQNTALSNY